jgi:cell shape-determining protein MreD
MNTFTEVLSIIGFIVRALGFAVLGFGVGRFTMEAYKKAVWQVQVALAVGFFALLVGLTNYASAGSMGMFALGAGIAIILSGMSKKEEDTDT